MKPHPWRSYLTAEEAQDMLATEKHFAWAKTQMMAAKEKINEIRNRAVKRATADRCDMAQRRSVNRELAARQ